MGPAAFQPSLPAFSMALRTMMAERREASRLTAFSHPPRSVSGREQRLSTGTAMLFYGRNSNLDQENEQAKCDAPGMPGYRGLPDHAAREGGAGRRIDRDGLEVRLHSGPAR